MTKAPMTCQAKQVTNPASHRTLFSPCTVFSLDLHSSFQIPSRIQTLWCGSSVGLSPLSVEAAHRVAPEAMSQPTDATPSIPCERPHQRQRYVSCMQGNVQL